MKLNGVAKHAHDKKEFSTAITERFFIAMDTIVGTWNGKKISAVKFGETVGSSSSNLGRIRTKPGKYFVTLEAIGLLCHHYGVSATWLINGQGDPFGNDEADKSLQGRVDQLERSFADLQKAVGDFKKTLKH